MSGQSFVHLHVHTMYSLLDGAIRVGPLVSRVAELGMPAVAMTDHGNMFGAVEFFKKCKKSGVKPIIGIELDLTTGSLDDPRSGSVNHLTVLARNDAGYRNLMRLTSRAHLDGYVRGQAYADRSMLDEFRDGLIALSGDLGGEIPRAILRGDLDSAEQTAGFYRDLFGPDHFYLEVMDNKFPEQARVNEALVELGRKLSIPLVASNDCHYLSQDEAAAHAVLMCIQLQKTIDLQQATSHGIDSFYLKSPDEMWAAFSDLPEACENTLKIADMVDFEMTLGQVFLPQYRVPDTFYEVRTEIERGSKNAIHEYFRHVAREGLEARIAQLTAQGRTVDVKAYHDRLDIELGVICDMDFPGYFLIVWDFIRWSKEQGISVGPGRGSGAGSLVAYSMLITDINPMDYGLLFERFLNPERVSMPDFDIDFCMNRRGEVIEYVTRKYGEMNVGQIVTYGALKAKACIRDVARTLNFSYADGDRIAKLVPDELGITLQGALDMEPKLRRLVDEDPRVKELFTVALQLEGLYRQTGMHAAGIVISEEPLWEYVPICRGAGDELVTQYAKNEVEEAGLVKFDFLGLKTLTVIDEAVALVNDTRAERGEDDLVLAAIPMNDRPVFKLLSEARTTGVFQLESSGFKELLAKLKPDCFEDIVAAVALYRPGPLGSGMVDDFVRRKHGEIAVEYPHPWTEEILRETYGVIVYQEQVMQIAQKLAGYSLGGADIMRRAMGKKKMEEMAKQRAIFCEGAEKLGVDPGRAGEIFDLIEYFAGYGFNKCVVGSTVVPDARTGRRHTVDELFARRDDLHGVEVHALGEDGKLRARPVTDVVYNGHKPVFELRTEQGHTLTATGNHPLRTLDGWVNLEDLSPGDLIATPRHLPVESGERWPRHELIALGGLLSEGNTCHPSCLYYYNNKESLIADFAQAAVAFEHSVARLDRRSGGRLEVCVSTGRDARFSAGQTPWNAGGAAPAVDVSPSRSGMFRWAEDLGILGCRASEKFVPEAAFALCDEDLAVLLGRMWSGDGFVANKTQAVPFYATSSRQLARDVHDLLLRLGILSGVHEKSFRYRGQRRPGYTVHLVGEGARERFLERIGPHLVGRERQLAHLRAALALPGRAGSSKDLVPFEVRVHVDEARRAAGLSWRALERDSGVCVKEFYGKGRADKRGYRRSTIARLARFLESPRLAEIASSDVFWDRVVSIEPRGVEATFDLTVAEDHNFVADGLVVHNSHSAAYALISYQTAWLKTHYPVEFTAALLTCDRENTAKVVRTIFDARDSGIEVLPPDVNESKLDFSVASGKIRFGLGAVKGVGTGAIEAIIEARTGPDGRFDGLFDFCERVDLRRVNKRVLEALVRCGAFDSTWNAPLETMRDIGAARARMLEALSLAIDRGQRTQAEREAGQTSLFDMFAAHGPDIAPDAPENYPDAELWSDKKVLHLEKQTLGFYVTGHPLDRYADELRLYTTCDTSTIVKRENREEVAVAGVVASMRERVTKSGSRVAFFMLEDMVGQVEVLCFSKCYAEYEEVIKADEPLLIRGQVSIEGDDAAQQHKIRASEVQLLTQARADHVAHVMVEFPVQRASEQVLRTLRELLGQHPGDCRTYLRLQYPDLGHATLPLPDDFKVSPTDEFMNAVEGLFGGKQVVKLR